MKTTFLFYLLFVLSLSAQVEVTDGNPIDSDSTKFTIENSVNQFNIEDTVGTKVGYQYWFVDKNFLDGRTLKM
ncbi:MAG: hypothetical protein KDC52_16655, partial [Ignavibacteriae bacterium]|nr:hypothetical protein [Ignavibacteriota bacterium]